MKNAYRNPLVAEGMRVLGFVNKFNRGIKRVREQLAANGSPSAIYKVDQLTHFEVIVYSADPIENVSMRSMTDQPTIQPTIQATGQIQRLVSVISKRPFRENNQAPSGKLERTPFHLECPWKVCKNTMTLLTLSTYCAVSKMPEMSKVSEVSTMKGVTAV